MLDANRLLLTALLATGLGCAGAAEAAPAHHSHRSDHDAGAPVMLSREPGNSQDRAARMLAAEDMQSAAHHGETPLVLVGSARLAETTGRPAGKADPALFVQLQSASLCGSAGCSTSVYLRHRRRWHKVLDSVSGPIRVMKQAHRGMHDLMVGRKDRWIWDGSVYQDSLAAPSMDSLRRSIERHRARLREQPNAS